MQAEVAPKPSGGKGEQSGSDSSRSEFRLLPLAFGKGLDLSRLLPHFYNETYAQYLPRRTEVRTDRVMHVHEGGRDTSGCRNSVNQVAEMGTWVFGRRSPDGERGRTRRANGTGLKRHSKESEGMEAGGTED